MMVKVFLLITLLLVPFYGFAEEIEWDEASMVSADINCDGVTDTAKLGYIEGGVRLLVSFGGTNTEQFIEFGLGQPGYQDALCGTEAHLSIEDMGYDLIEVFGENPEGFQPSKVCSGLNVSAGECDSMHVFWNHKQKHINWWRL